MEEHLKSRPNKTIFSTENTHQLRNKAIKKLKNKLLPDNKIIKIILIGSSVKYQFGEYEPPGFRGSLFSDFDFIIFVEPDFIIPPWLDKEPDGKPFSEDSMNLAYRNKKFIDNKYDAEVFFIRKPNMENLKIQELGEQAGIPMTSNSKHKQLIIYEKK
ncbi:hypothetical protein HN587_05265 [Candidatus Woesearchaeota archaeon]|jgi:hypothetical protein|nr:hypothetical protein [Candidatus Woesearchaeota archaeon]